jgi:hypothetical protein
MPDELIVRIMFAGATGARRSQRVEIFHPLVKAAVIRQNPLPLAQKFTPNNRITSDGTIRKLLFSGAWRMGMA